MKEEYITTIGESKELLHTLTMPIFTYRLNLNNCRYEIPEIIKKEVEEMNKYDILREWEEMQNFTFSFEHNRREDIKDINIIVPNKVVEVIFYNGKEKMVCHEDDKFDLRNCLFIAIAKHLYKKEYTQEGIEYKANEMKYMKKYVKIVDDAIKAYNRKMLELKRLEENQKAELERIERKRAKRAKYKARREQRRKDAAKAEQIEIQKEAYIQAMKSVCAGE